LAKNYKGEELSAIVKKKGRQRVKSLGRKGADPRSSNALRGRAHFLRFIEKLDGNRRRDAESAKKRGRRRKYERRFLN